VTSGQARNYVRGYTLEFHGAVNNCNVLLKDETTILQKLQELL